MSQELKQYVLQNNIHVQVNKLSKVVNTSKDEAEARTAFYSQLFLCLEHSQNNDPYEANALLHSAELINDAYYHRLARLKSRVRRMCDIGCCFLTLTFNDEQFRKTLADTRSQAVQRYLKCFDVPYCANIDFGAENGREHYHALICAPLEQLALTPWTRGYCYYEEMGTTRVFRGDKGIYERTRKKRDDTPESDFERTSRYINKLSNHAVKATTHNARIKYSQHIDHKLTEIEEELGITSAFIEEFEERQAIKYEEQHTQRHWRN